MSERMSAAAGDRYYVVAYWFVKYRDPCWSMCDPALVIDIGSDCCKAGLSSDPGPQLVIKSVTGRPPGENDINCNFKPTTICKRSNNITIGEDAIVSCGHLVKTFPVSRGTVTDWSSMESIIDHVYERLAIKPDEKPVFLTEPPYNPMSHRESAAEVFMEHYHAPYFHITIDTPLVLYGAGRTFGVAVNCGDGVTSVISMYDDCTFTQSSVRQDLAGRDISFYLSQLMGEKGYSVLARGLKHTELNKIKEKTAIASLYAVDDSESTEPVTYTLPDGSCICLDEERYKCLDVLFQPSLIGREYLGIHSCVHKSVQQAQIDCRRELYRNIVLGGGTAKIEGLGARLQSEVEGLAPEKVKVSVASPSICQIAAWCGAANMASLSSFQPKWISKTEYQEYGVNVGRCEDVKTRRPGVTVIVGHVNKNREKGDFDFCFFNGTVICIKYLMENIRYIKTVSAAEKAVTDILTKEKPVVGVKCLGVNLGEHGGYIILVAVSCWDGRINLFDVKVCPKIMYDGGILRMLQSVELLKVFHNCGSDCATLYKQFGITVKNFFDTQIAHSIIMEKEGLSPRRVSLHRLCEVYNAASYIPSMELQRLLIEDPNVWARRPITKDMQKMASSFVAPLVPQIFTQTDSALPPSTDDWFTHLCQENRLSRLVKTTSGPRSKTKCPRNRKQTLSHHLVPMYESMHFCL